MDRGGRGRGRGNRGGGQRGGRGGGQVDNLTGNIQNMNISGRGGRGDNRGARGGRGGNFRGRGRGRGRPERDPNYDVVCTRPETDGQRMDKKGKSGTPMNLITNYIGFKKRPDACLFKYRVDFKSKQDGELETYIKKNIFKRLRAQLPPFLFDGTMCYLPQKTKQTKFTSTFEGIGGANTPVDIELRVISELHPTDNDYVHVRKIFPFSWSDEAIFICECTLRTCYDYVYLYFYFESLAFNRYRFPIFRHFQYFSFPCLLLRPFSILLGTYWGRVRDASEILLGLCGVFRLLSLVIDNISSLVLQHDQARSYRAIGSKTIKARLFRSWSDNQQTRMAS